jgi:hypothetical protein
MKIFLKIKVLNIEWDEIKEHEKLLTYIISIYPFNSFFFQNLNIGIKFSIILSIKKDFNLFLFLLSLMNYIFLYFSFKISSQASIIKFFLGLHKLCPYIKSL